MGYVTSDFRAEELIPAVGRAEDRLARLDERGALSERALSSEGTSSRPPRACGWRESLSISRTWFSTMRR